MSQLTTAVHDSQANPLRNAWDWSGAAKVALGREWSLKLFYSSNFHRSQLCFSHIGSLGVIHPPWSRTRSPHSRKLIINRSGTKDKHFGHRGFLPFLINLLELLLFLYAYTLNHKDAVKVNLWEALYIKGKKALCPWAGYLYLSFLSPSYLICKWEKYLFSKVL